MYLLFIDSHKNVSNLTEFEKNHVIKTLYVSVEQDELRMIGMHTKGTFFLFAKNIANKQKKQYPRAVQHT